MRRAATDTTGLADEPTGGAAGGACTVGAGAPTGSTTAAIDETERSPQPRVETPVVDSREILETPAVVCDDAGTNAYSRAEPGMRGANCTRPVADVTDVPSSTSRERPSGMAWRVTATPPSGRPRVTRTTADTLARPPARTEVGEDSATATPAGSTRRPSVRERVERHSGVASAVAHSCASGALVGVTSRCARPVASVVVRPTTLSPA